MILFLDIAKEALRNPCFFSGEIRVLESFLLAQPGDIGSVEPLSSKSDHITHARASDRSDPHDTLWHRHCPGRSSAYRGRATGVYRQITRHMIGRSSGWPA